MNLQSRHQLFPQIFGFVKQYVAQKINFNDIDPREPGLDKYAKRVVQDLCRVIRPDEASGEPPLLPVLNRYRPVGSTATVDFVTTRATVPATRSHINSVVLHSSWEGDAAQVMDSDEAEDIVSLYARNDHLGLHIPYEFLDSSHVYEPDFLVRLSNDLIVILEVKGYEQHSKDQNAAKHQAARQWVAAVNNLKQFGQWKFLVCREVEQLLPELAKLVGSSTETAAESDSPRV